MSGTATAGGAPRRRLTLLGCLFVAAALAPGVGHWAWRRANPTRPPDVDLSRAQRPVVEAVEAARREVERAPRSASAWGLLGMVLCANDFAEEGRVCLAEAERLDPKDPRWPYLQVPYAGNVGADRAVPLLRRAAERCGDEPTPRLRLGEVLLEQGRPREAEELFRAVLSVQPANARAHLGLGRAARDQGDLKTSRRHLLRSAQLAPGVRPTHALLAEVYHLLGEADAADDERRRLAGLSGDLPWVDPYYEQALRLGFGVPARLELAEAFWRQGRQQDAVTVLRETVAAHPDSAEARVALVMYLVQTDDAAGAEAPAREAVRLAPESAGAHFALGTALLQQGKRAAACFRRATELQPRFAAAYYNLGLSLQKERDRSGAFQAFREAVRYKPDYAAAHLSLGLLLADAGQYADAVRHLEQAAELAPDDEDARRALEQARRRAERPGPR